MMNLRVILNKVWVNTPLSDEESEFLSQQISTAEGKEDLDAALFALWDEFDAVEMFDEDRSFDLIRQQLGQESIPDIKSLRSIYKRMLPYVAAAVMLLVGAFYWLLRSPESTTKADNILAAENQVELITADGRKIILENGQDLPQGFSLEGDTSDTGQLVYSDSSTLGDQETAYITLKVPRGETYNLQLPDGTKVYLNAMTTLRFPEKFSRESRNVYLNGEAAFAVKSNKQSPFYVHTEQRTVEVTGTKFNVTAYDDDKLWRTALFEGKVNVLGGKKAVVMIPNQQYELDRASGESWLKHFAKDEETFAPWASGMLDFKSAELGDITRQLQRWYDFTITYDSPALQSKRFTATISKNEPINTFFNIIEQTTDIEITVKGNHISVGKRAPN